MQNDEAVRLYVVSIDTPENSRGFAKKIAADGRGPITFPLLFDQGHRVIDAYGLRDPAYKDQEFDGVPYPTVYIVDREGQVAWAKINEDYKQRASNQEIRSALSSLR